MRRRKKTILAALAVLSGIAALIFWPRDHPFARRAFAAVRELVEVQPAAKPYPDPEPAIDTSAQIQIDIVIAKLNLTEARTRLFAATVPSNKLIVGRVASAQAVLEILQALDVASIVSEPRLVLLSGQTGKVIIGGEVAVLPIGVGAPLTYQDFGTKVGVHAKITGSSTVRLEFDCELSYLAGRKTVATPQGPVEQPDVKAVRASAHAEVKSGEALFLGGLAQKAFGRVAHKAPYLGDLPGIGSWFCFSREREFDEELVVLVTPRIVSPAKE